MKTLIIVAHPQLATSATQQFLQASAAPLTNVTWHALPAALDLAAEQALLFDADRIVLQFPLYWYAAPAALKAWLDTVWQAHLVDAARGGRLRGKQLGLVVSLGQPEAAFQLGGAVGVSLSTLLAPYAALARRTGMTLLPPLPIAQFSYQTEQAHQRLLIRYQQYLTAASQHFADRQAWWQARLAQATPEQAALAEYVANQAEEYERLQDTLRELKAEDDG